MLFAILFASVTIPFYFLCFLPGFAIYRLDEPDAVTMPLDTDFFKYHASAARPKSFINLRELTARFKLKPGTYVVIPSTFNPNEEGDFCLRYRKILRRIMRRGVA